MSDGLVYLSEQWREEAGKRLAQLSLEETEGASVSMTSVYKNCPDGSDRYTHTQFLDGRLQVFDSGNGEGPDSDLCVTADYSVFVQMAKGELSGQMAMMTGKLKVKGNMMRLMKYAPLSERVSKTISCIPTVYE